MARILTQEEIDAGGPNMDGWVSVTGNRFCWPEDYDMYIPPEEQVIAEGTTTIPLQPFYDWRLSDGAKVAFVIIHAYTSTHYNKITLEQAYGELERAGIEFGDADAQLDELVCSRYLAAYDSLTGEQKRSGDVLSVTYSFRECPKKTYEQPIPVIWFNGCRVVQVRKMLPDFEERGLPAIIVLGKDVPLDSEDPIGDFIRLQPRNSE